MVINMEEEEEEDSLRRRRGREQLLPGIQGHAGGEGAGQTRREKQLPNDLLVKVPRNFE